MNISNDIAQEILHLEKQYWQAMQNSDLDKALSLTDFPCVVAGAHGAQSVDKESYKKMFESHKGVIKDFSFNEDKFEVRQVTADTVITAYELKSSFKKEGRVVESNAVDTSTWIRKGGKWLCVMHTETEIAKQEG